jgi:hypothetical protein
MTLSPLFKKRFITGTAILFIVESIVMQFIYSSFNFFKTPLSDYGTGKYGLIICSGLVLIGINYLLLFNGFKKVQASGRCLALGNYLLFIVGISVFFIACFQTDIGHVVSLRGRIHVIATHTYFIILPFSAGFLLLGLRNYKDRFYKIGTLIFCVVCFIAAPVLGFDDVFHTADFSGLIQKSLILLILVWIISTAHVLYRHESRKPA